MSRSSFTRQDGFTFNEILAALSLAVVTVMGYSLNSLQLIQRQTASANATIAVHLAQDKLEEILARKNPAEVDLCSSGGEHGISAKPGAGGIFERCWRIAPSTLSPALKQIDVTVSWRDTESHDITFSTLVYTGEGS